MKLAIVTQAQYNKNNEANVKSFFFSFKQLHTHTRTYAHPNTPRERNKWMYSFTFTYFGSSMCALCVYIYTAHDYVVSFSSFLLFLNSAGIFNRNTFFLFLFGLPPFGHHHPMMFYFNFLFNTKTSITYIGYELSLPIFVCSV